MMFFGIPLTSKKVSTDWQQTVRLLDATLRSVLNQTEPNVRVIVACHDLPAVEAIDDPRLEFVSAAFPPPIFDNERIVDKHRKRELIGAQVRNHGGGYLMMVDADDLVSKHLAEFVLRDGSPHGYYVADGYEYDYAVKKVRECPRFHHLSGSCAIFRCEPEDLPRAPLSSENSPFRELLNTNHPRWPAYMESLGRPLTPLPFRSCMYVWNHGQNLSVFRNNIGQRRQLLRRMQFARRPTPEMVDEFGLDL